MHIYNRYDKQADEELGKKSIDIFNEKHEKKIEVTDRGMVYNYCVNRIK